MPNGDHEFDTKTKLELDEFFAPIARQIEDFALRHNLRLTKYYHQWHQWDFTFRHPHGGVGKINVMKESESTIKIGCGWWMDDYDEGTRSGKSGVAKVIPVDGVDCEVKLSEALRQTMGWNIGEWTTITPGFADCWHRMSRETFEDLSLYPVPSTNEFK
jgi:hypothetical protein